MKCLVSLIAIVVAGCGRTCILENEIELRRSQFEANTSLFQETLNSIKENKNVKSEVKPYDPRLHTIGITRVLIYTDCIVFDFFSDTLDSRRAIVFLVNPGEIQGTSSIDKFPYSFHRQIALSKKGWYYVLYD